MLATFFQTGLGVEAPFFSTGVGVQRNGHAVRRAQVQAVANLQWRGLVRGFMYIARAFLVAGLNLPGYIQLVHVFCSDLAQLE